jgi:hypothetical protein
MPDSYVRWLEFQHTPLPKFDNNPGSRQVQSKRNARSRSATRLDKLLQIYELTPYATIRKTPIFWIRFMTFA